MKTLIIGYGNPGRQDDGLGPALGERIEKLALDGVSVDIDYQLNIEHAHDLAGFERVIFIDAHLSLEHPYSYRPVTASPHAPYSSHSVAPETVLHLAKELFQAEPKAFILAIRGYHFAEIEEGLSHKAKENLLQAEQHLLEVLSL